ncbi:Mucin-3A like [Quillaja saponaria]|uniref:Mucin-3A like n=1 Tax=Quillaja saponaria TaxID=32244 RepID=A0AAD7KPC7_QUISA|nr:Mucin-3A like [Quillaja saponaria]
MTMANKKAKRKDENVKEIVGKEGLEEERRDDGNMGLVGAAENVMGYQENCYWPWLSNFVDEQMSWGSIWLPIWDMDLMGEAFAASFSDVAWDDDIWNLKNAKQFPNP